MVAFYADLPSRLVDFKRLKESRGPDEKGDEWLWARNPNGFAPVCGGSTRQLESPYGYRDSEDEWQIMVIAETLDKEDNGKEMNPNGSGIKIEWIKQKGAKAYCNGNDGECGEYEASVSHFFRAPLGADPFSRSIDSKAPLTSSSRAT